MNKITLIFKNRVKSTKISRIGRKINANECNCWPNCRCGKPCPCIGD